MIFQFEATDDNTKSPPICTYSLIFKINDLIHFQNQPGFLSQTKQKNYQHFVAHLRHQALFLRFRSGEQRGRTRKKYDEEALSVSMLLGINKIG